MKSNLREQAEADLSTRKKYFFSCVKGMKEDINIKDGTQSA